jgi:hypothetical protein
MQSTQVPGSSNFKKGRIFTLINFSALSPNKYDPSAYAIKERMYSSTLGLIAIKLTMKDEERLCEVKDNLNKLSTKDPGSHEPSTRDNLYR